MPEPSENRSSYAATVLDVPEVATTNSNLRLMKTRVRRVSPPQEASFLKLDNGDLADLIENPENPDQTLFAVCHDGDVRYADKVECNGQTFVPMPRNSALLSDVRLPRGVQPYGTLEILIRRMRGFIAKCVRLPGDYLLLLVYFMIYTQFDDLLPIAVCLLVLGLPGSGKTTLLELLRLLCRRAIMVSDMSLAATSEICTAFTPTFLMDENEWGCNRGNIALRQLLRAATTQHALARRKGSVTRIFGPRVLTALKPPDDPGLMRRWIQMPMTEVNDVELIKPDDPRLSQEVETLQSMLLQLRFDLYPKIKPAVIQGPEAKALRPGTRDILGSLAAPFTDFPEAGQFLAAFLSVFHDSQSREPLSTVQNAIVAALFRFIHETPNSQAALVGGIGWTANQALAEAKERVRLSPKGAGGLLSSLGFARRVRTNRGSAVLLDLNLRKEVHRLVEDYGNDYVAQWIGTTGIGNCELCAKQAGGAK